MKTRVISGVFLFLIIATVLLSGGPVLFVFTLLISVKGFLELTRAMKVRVNFLTNKENIAAGTKHEGRKSLADIFEETKGMNLLEVIGICGILGYYSVLFFAKTSLFVMLTITLTIILLLFAYVFAFPKYEARQIMSTVFSFVYAPIMLGYLYLTRELEHGFYIVWLIIISSWVCDTCAYFFGVMFGKHKLAPVLSPKKSIEGSIGGIFGSAVVGFLLAYLLYRFNLLPGKDAILWGFPLICAVGAMVSQVGDLAASGIKRNFDIKDYGTLIPGHGGIIDRFDSVIFTAPMIYYLAVLILAIQ